MGDSAFLDNQRRAIVVCFANDLSPDRSNLGPGSVAICELAAVMYHELRSEGYKVTVCVSAAFAPRKKPAKGERTLVSHQVVTLRKFGVSSLDIWKGAPGWNSEHELRQAVKLHERWESEAGKVPLYLVSSEPHLDRLGVMAITRFGLRNIVLRGVAQGSRTVAKWELVKFPLRSASYVLGCWWQMVLAYRRLTSPPAVRA